MKRLAALVAAAAMIAGGLYLHDLRTGSSSDDPDGDRPPSREVRVLCAEELGTVCVGLASDGVSVTREPAGTTADRLADPEQRTAADFDVWLTDAAWPGVVADNREVAGLRGALLGEPSAVLGRSPATIAVPASRLDALAESCDGEITWRCLGERSASGLAVGLPTPDRGDGLVILASAVADYFDRTDYATNDFDADVDFDGWFEDLTSASSTQRLGGRTPLQAALSQTGLFHVVGALESDPGRFVDRFGSWSTTYPEPMVTSDIVLVPADGVDLDDALRRIGSDRLAEVLADSGWRVPGVDLHEDLDPGTDLPPSQNLPRSGVLQNLRDRW